MPSSSQKRVAADILKCGMSRVRISSPKEAADALTRNDIRDLIDSGVIYKIPKAGTTHGYAKATARQKKKGRRSGRGSRKGSAGARAPTKKLWMIKVRAQRRLLRELIEKQQVTKDNYRQVYYWIKGGMFRSRQHLLLTLREKGMLGRAQVNT